MTLPTVDLTREADVQAGCVSLLQTYGYTVAVFSERRRSRITPGVPDLYAQHARGVRLWWETKHDDRKLTAAQHAFLSRELSAGGLAGCGDKGHLASVLELLARTVSVPAGQRRCRELVELLALRGYARE